MLVIADSEQDMPGIKHGPLGSCCHTNAVTTELQEVKHQFIRSSLSYTDITKQALNPSKPQQLKLFSLLKAKLYFCSIQNASKVKIKT